MKARYGELANKVRALCARDIGCSLKDASEALDRPLNTASVYAMNLVNHGEVVKAGVHGEYRYFKDRQKAAEHDLVAKESRRIQVIESKKKKDAKRAQYEREKRARIRAEKGLPPYDPAEHKKKEKPPKPAKQAKEPSIKQTKEWKPPTPKVVNIVWPENVKVIKRETPKDYRFFNPPAGWKGEFLREFEKRRSA